jgi:hypothetical protein
MPSAERNSRRTRVRVGIWISFAVTTPNPRVLDLPPPLMADQPNVGFRVRREWIGCTARSDCHSKDDGRQQQRTNGPQHFDARAAEACACGETGETCQFAFTWRPTASLHVGGCVRSGAPTTVRVAIAAPSRATHIVAIQTVESSSVRAGAGRCAAILHVDRQWPFLVGGHQLREPSCGLLTRSAW